MTGEDHAIRERNRELLARRLRWPPGALDECRAFERDFPGWCAWWSATCGYGASPVHGPAIRRRTYHAPAAEALRTQVRQDISRRAAEGKRDARLPGR